MESVYFPKPSADAITHNSMAEFCGYRVSNPIGIPAVFTAIHNKIRIYGTLPLRIQTPEITILF